MFLISSVCGYVPNLLFSRAISCSSSCYSNHYMTLGLTPAATQDDIKKAYFELCKKYHPDKNEGSAESTKMFRLITEAYETLGNEKLRKLYDQKMFYGGAANTHKWKVHRPEDYSYEAERFFYERRNINRMHMGKTWYYDFDAWTNAHYPKTKNRDLNNMKDRRRHWRNLDPQNSGQFHKRRGVPFFWIHVIIIITIASVFAIMPVVHYQSFGIDYGSGETKGENVRSPLKKQDFSKKEP